jgi:hypothetical protein
MADTRDLDTLAVPSPLPPTEAELAAWNALTREQQIDRYRAYLAAPECQTFTTDTPDEILAAARAKVAARRHG